MHISSCGKMNKKRPVQQRVYEGEAQELFPASNTLLEELYSPVMVVVIQSRLSTSGVVYHSLRKWENWTRWPDELVSNAT